jgi:hypothetical protein
LGSELAIAQVIPPCADTVWERVGNTLEMHSGLVTGLRELQCCTHTCTAAANDDSVK